MKRPLVLLSLLASLQSPVIGKETKPEYTPLEISDVVKIISEYDIHRMTVPPNHDAFGGWSIYLGITNMTDKTMDLNKVATPEVLKLTILHEMRHARNYERGLSQREDWIKEQACKDYKLFFKEKNCPDQNNLETAIKWEYR